MIKEILEKEEQEKSERKVLVVDDEKNFGICLRRYFRKTTFSLKLPTMDWTMGRKPYSFSPQS